MVTTKQMNIKNKTYYFYDGMVNIKKFDPNLLKLDKKSFKTLVFITMDILQKNINTKLIV